MKHGRVFMMAVLLLLAAAPGVVLAQGLDTLDDLALAGGAGSEGDYDTGSERWNGLNTLTAVAEGVGLTVEAADSMDWNNVEAGDIVVLLYPTARLEPTHVATFIRNGGSLLIADDFGDSTEALSRLGMLRKPAVGVGAERFYRDLSYVPMARPLAPGHPLADGVSEIATNHPAILTQVQGPEVVFGFAPDEAVVVAGTVGAGRFIVVSDPSVFINRMLQFQGNLNFTINALRFLAGPEGAVPAGKTRRLILLSRDFSLYGEPENVFDDNTVSGTLGNLLSDVNRWLEEINDYLLTQAGMRAASVLVALAVALIALVSIPVRRKRPLDGSWTHAQAMIEGNTGFAELVGRFEADNPTNYIVPAAVLRDTLNQRLARQLGQADPLHTMTRQELFRAVNERCGITAAKELDLLYQPLRALPSRAQAVSPWSAGTVSRREFERLCRDADALYLALPEEPR